MDTETKINAALALTALSVVLGIRDAGSANQGPPGAAGATGPAGAAGATGPAGPAGAAGTPGLFSSWTEKTSNGGGALSGAVAYVSGGGNMDYHFESTATPVGQAVLRFVNPDAIAGGMDGNTAVGSSGVTYRVGGANPVIWLLGVRVSTGWLCFSATLAGVVSFAHHPA